MRRAALLLLVGVLGIALSRTVAPVLPAGVPLPDVALLVALFGCLRLDEPSDSHSLLVAVSLGAVTDVLNRHPLGLFALAYMLVMILLRSAVHRIQFSGPALTILLGLVASLAVYGGSCLLIALLSRPDSPRFFPGRGALLGALATGACAPIVFYALDMAQLRVSRRPTQRHF